MAAIESNTIDDAKVMNYPTPAFETKICPPETLAARINALPRPLVFTNGCFDILHRGHVTYLAQARALGAAMVVALNSDASVKRQGKGEDRPINPLADRLAVMAALGSVDLVTWFDEDTPLARILDSRPDVLVKGGDWTPERIVGAAEVRAWGGAVHSIPFVVERSTTAQLQRGRTTRPAPGSDRRHGNRSGFRCDSRQTDMHRRSPAYRAGNVNFAAK